MTAKRNLLLGILALQNSFINRAQLLGAFNAWIEDKNKSLGTLLREHKALSPEQHALLEALVAEHLRQHDQDADKSLAALSSHASARAELAQLADPDVQASLAFLVPSGSHAAGADGASQVTDTAPGRSAGAGRFRILRPHAAGGLGEVSVALDQELNREVALKEIQARHADNAEARARFVLEAEVTGALEHPGIVPVYSLGAYGDGRPFYTMRFIKGDSLKEAIAQFHGRSGEPSRIGDAPGPARLAVPTYHSLDFRKLLGRLVDVCNAVAYAHSRGVLHRDLKPGNIMLGKYGETLVVDWGLAKAGVRRQGEEVKAEVSVTIESLLRPGTASGSSETLPGSALGTPAYMSPEQAAGRLDQLGPASDVYAPGATLYHLLTGKPPFKSGDAAAILKQVQAGDFPLPRRVQPTVPAALEAICLKAMAPRPEKRFPTARALADDLEHWLADEPVQAFREGPLARLGRWCRRHRAATASAAVLLLTAVAGLSVTTVLVGREQAETERARDRAEKAATLAEQRLKQAEANYQLAREAVDRNYTKVTANKLFADPNLDPLRRELLQTALEFYQRLGQTQREEAASTAERGRATERLAAVALELKDGPKAAELFAQALTIHEALVRDHPDVTEHRENMARCHFGLGQVHDTASRLPQSRAAFREGLATWDECERRSGKPPTDGRGRARCQQRLASASFFAGDTAGAEQEYQKAMERWQALAQADPQDAGPQDGLAECLAGLGWLYFSTGRLDRAEDAYLRAQAIHAQLLRANPDVAYYRDALASDRGRLGQVYTATKEWSKAEAALRQAIPLIEELAFPQNRRYVPSLSVEYDSLGRVYYYSGVLDQAEKMFDKSLMLKRRPGDAQNAWDDCHWAITQMHLGKVYRDSARHAKARAIFDQALGTMQKLIKAHPENIYFLKVTARAEEGLGKLTCQTGDLEEALAWYERSLATIAELLRREPRETDGKRYLHAIREGRAVVLTRLGRYSEAAQDFDAAAALSAVADRPPPHDHETYRTACLCARTATAVRKDGKLLPAEREPLAAGYLDRAVTLLLRAESLGYFADPANVANLKENADLAGVRDRSEFKRLLAELEIKARGPKAGDHP